MFKAINIRIFDAASVHVFPRIGAPPIVSDKPFKQIEWLDGLHPKTDHEGTSSTLVRSMSPYGALWPLCRSPKASLELHVHPDVVKYMEARGLYMFAPEILRRYWRQRALFSAFHVVAITMMYLNS